MPAGGKPSKRDDYDLLSSVLIQKRYITLPHRIAFARINFDRKGRLGPPPP
jgi:hypothetical protein